MMSKSPSALLVTLLATVLLLACTSPTTNAQLQSGQNNCRGWDISQSKYCSAFGRHLLGPTNLTDILFFAMVRNVSLPEDVELVRNIRADNIQSAAEFDSKVMEAVILDPKTLPDLNHRWFRCRFENLGVQYSTSWFCNLLLNPLSGSCPKNGAPNPPSLCRDSLTLTFQSAQGGVSKDESCRSLNQSQFSEQVNRVFSNFFGFNRTSSLDTATCFNSKLNEDPRKLCGYPTQAMACANRCAETSCNGTGNNGGGGSLPGTGGTLNPGSKEGGSGADAVGTSNTLVIVLSVVGSIVLVGAAAVGFVMYRRRQQQNPHAHSLYVSSSESGFGGSSAVALGKPMSGGNGKLGPYSMAERGAADIDVPTVGRAGSGLAMASVPAATAATSDPSAPPVLPLNLPMPLSPTGTGNGSADPVLIRRPPSTKLSTLTPPPRTSFYENDDMESIAPEDSASNVGINPRYRPGSNFRPSSALLVPGTNGAPAGAGKPATSPLAATAKAQAAAAAAAAAEAVNTLPTMGRVTLPNGLVAHMVFHTYHPRLDDELQVAPKDLLHVTEVYSDGWGRATQVDPATGEKVGKSGVFPVAALEPVVSPSQLSGSAAGAGGSQVKAQQVPLPGSPQ
ncbi:hypothetical protein BCR44DRAFT_1269574 [Catenaria anguillulae PL171]|uniref:SH3 domain-containing protein n=1 Tax=Catenaria anguillulae PL171 TaxID=765915 RepID=A0A1Y2HZQ1_9FUNG|nr:hypothetical protein BCR44DRAFT_1269574 [Catenaria anguillulae PL171]